MKGDLSAGVIGSMAHRLSVEDINDETKFRFKGEFKGKGNPWVRLSSTELQEMEDKEGMTFDKLKGWVEQNIVII